MIINNIELTNFKSHKSTKIEFKKGISLILGENGAGKSSILEAISYAFFKQVNGKLEENIRKPQNRKDIVDKMKKRVIQIEKGNIIRDDKKGGYNSEI